MGSPLVAPLTALFDGGGDEQGQPGSGVGRAGGGVVIIAITPPRSHLFLQPRMSRQHILLQRHQ